MSVITLTIKTKMYKLLFFFCISTSFTESQYQQGNPHLCCKGNILVCRGLSV